MRKTFLKAAAISRRLARARSGVAMVEFALVLPFFMGTSLMAIELANFANANLRVSQIALSVADNAGRVRTSIDETDIEEVMIGARLQGENIDFGENGRLVLYAVEPNMQASPNDGQTIRWMRCFGNLNHEATYGDEGDGALNGSLRNGVGPDGRKIAAMNGAVVMLVEVKYEYQRIAPMPYTDRLMDTEIDFSASYIVRQRNAGPVTNLRTLPNSQRRTCDRFSAT